MKALSFLATVSGVGAGLALMIQSASAGLPQPMCIYYGQAHDSYGLPYRTNAEVILVSGTTEIARHTIRGSLSPGVNFALYAHLDDGSSPIPYSQRALRSGDLVSVVVRDREGVRTILESQSVPPVGKPGELLLIEVTAGEDLDRDGLPDAWEWELIAWSWGALNSLADVRGEDDFDGDGMTNLQEYRAGTFAFLDYDYLFVEQLERTLNNRLRLTLLSVPGKVYNVEFTADLQGGDWKPSPFALSDVAPFQETPVEGNGDWLSLYVPIDTTTWFFRLEAK